MKKLSRSAYEDMKGFVRVAETWLEVLVLTLIYFLVWKNGYDFFSFEYMGKYVLMGVYAVLLYVFFQNSDCTLFGQLNRVDLIMGQVIALFLVNFVTYLQLCLIAEALIDLKPMLILFGIDILVAVLMVFLFTTLYHRIYAPHDMLLIYGSKRGVGLKIKMDSRKDKYNISKLICAEEGLDKIFKEIPKYDAVILNDIPAQTRNDIL